MANSVDTRVVELQFDNAQFERGAKTTLSTLDKLKASLRFDGIEKGFNAITVAAGNVDFSSINKGITTVQTSMTAFQQVMFGVFERIGQKAADLGMTITNELLVAQKKAGFGEYELELGSVQTISASTGEAFDTIYGYLEELNTYADKTIYSFSDMTSNIGKFTNAGVELEDAVKAIQGISNEAALSGANAQEASRAMYNFAQALSAGSVKLIDWKSIENANMATKEFKQELIDTAVELGTLKKTSDGYVSTTTDLQGKVADAFTSTSKFNESLSAQWMTTEVLTKTLSRYSDETTDIGKRAYSAAQDVKSFTQLIDTLKEAIGSGWAQTFRLVFGTFEEAKVTWTAVNGVLSGLIDRFSEFRNHMLRFWRQEGGRESVILDIVRAWRMLSKTLGIVRKAFINIFPNIQRGGHVIVELGKQVQRFVKRVKKQFNENQDQITRLYYTWSRVFYGIKTILAAFRSVVKTVFTLVTVALKTIFGEFRKMHSLSYTFKELAEYMFRLATAFRDWALDADRMERFADFVQNAAGTVRNLAESLLIVAQILAQIAGLALKAFGEVAIPITGETIYELSASLLEFVKSLRLTERRSKTITSIFKALFTVGKLLVVVFGAIIRGLSKVFFGVSKTGVSAIGGLADALTALIEKFISFLTETNLIERAIEGIGGAFKGINSFVKGLTGKSILDNLLGIFDFFATIGQKVNFEEIGSSISEVGSSIAETVQYIWDNILHLGDENSGPAKLIGYFTSLGGESETTGDKVEDFGTRVVNALKQLKRDAKANLDRIGEFFIELAATVSLMADLIKLALDNIAGFTSEVIVYIVTSLVDEKTLNEISKSETFIGELWNKLTEIAAANAKGLNGNKLNMENLTDVLEKLLKGIKKSIWLIDAIIDAIFKIQISTAIWQFSSGIKNISKAFRDLTKGVKRLTKDVGKTAKIFARAKELGAFASVLVGFAALFLAIFAVIAGITAIFAFGGKKMIIPFIAAIVVMVGIIVAVSVAVSKLVKQIDAASDDNENFSVAMNSLAKVLLSLGVVMVLFAASVAALTAVIGKFGGGAFAAAAGTMAGMLILIFVAVGLLIHLMSKNDNITYGVFDVAKTFNELSKLMIAMGASMVLMAAAMAIIAAIPSQDFGRAAGTLVVMFIAMAALIFGVMFMANKSSGSTKALEGLSGVVIAMGASLIMLGVALAIIAGVVSSNRNSPETLGLAVGIIGVFMLVLGAIVVFAAKYANPSSIATIGQIGTLALALGGSMILLAIALSSIAKVVQMFAASEIDSDYIWMVVGIMGAMMAVMAVMGLLAKVVPGGAVTFIGIAAAFVILAAALSVLAVGLAAFDQLDTKSLANGFKTLGKTAGWMMLLGAGLIVAGAGALVFGIGLSAVAIPLLLLWPVIKGFVELWPKIQEMFTDTTNGMNDMSKASSSANGSLGAALGKTFGDFITAIAKTIKEKGPLIADALSALAEAAVKAFLAPLVGLGKGIVDTLIAVLTYVSTNINRILVPLGHIITTLMVFLAAMAPTIALNIAIILFEIFHAAITTLADNIDTIVADLFELFASTLEALAAMFTDENNERIAVAVRKIVDGLFDLIKEVFNQLAATKVADIGSDFIDYLVTSIKNGGNKIKQALNDLVGFELFKIEVEPEVTAGNTTAKTGTEAGESIYVDMWAEDADGAQQRLAATMADNEAGFQEGIEKQKQALHSRYDDEAEAASEAGAEAGAAFAESEDKAYREATGTNSPSEEAEKMGGYWGDGWIEEFKAKLPDIKSQFTDTFSSEGGMFDFGAEGSDSAENFMSNLDLSSYTGSANTDVSVTPVLDGNADPNDLLSGYNMDDIDYESMVNGTSDISQETKQTVDASINDETKATYENLTKAVQDLAAMLDGVTIVSDEATIATRVDVDGEPLAEAVIPFIDAKAIADYNAGKDGRASASTRKKTRGTKPAYAK